MGQEQSTPPQNPVEEFSKPSNLIPLRPSTNAPSCDVRIIRVKTLQLKARADSILEVEVEYDGVSKVPFDIIVGLMKQKTDAEIIKIAKVLSAPISKGSVTRIIRAKIPTWLSQNLGQYMVVAAVQGCSPASSNKWKKQADKKVWIR